MIFANIGFEGESRSFIIKRFGPCDMNCTAIRR